MSVWILEIILSGILGLVIAYIGIQRRRHMREISRLQKTKIIDFYTNTKETVELDKREPTAMDIVIRLKLLSDSLEFDYDKKTITLAINQLVRSTKYDKFQ